MNDSKPVSWEESVLWLRNQPDKQDIAKQCYYDDPIESAALRYYSSEEWHAVDKLLRHRFPCAVLDIGAGRGISSFAFAKSGCAVTALEPNRSAIVGSGCIKALFDKTDSHVTVVNDVGERLPFPDETFDIVYGRAVLHHAKDLPRFCSEAARVLRKRGLFLFTREHVISRKEDLPVFLQSHALHFLYKGENALLLSEYVDAIKSTRAKKLKILDPLSTPINYAPLDTQTVYSNVRKGIRRRLGNLISAKCISGTVVRLALRRISMRSDEPGRRYSFLGSK
jgi:SAM-dependent methyltransferase